MALPDFWSDQTAAQETINQAKELKEWVAPLTELTRWSEDLEVLLELAGEDEELAGEVKTQVEKIRKALDALEFKRMLSGDYDKNNAYFELHPGAGGTESQDWADMLLRMYLRWAERHGFKTKIVDYQPGDEAGLKRVLVQVSGPYAYGYLKAERGVHRLVRISPFDSNKRRHTSFTSFFAFPELADDVEDIEINEDDLRVDTYRSSGAGGQHVNTTDSAIRITHIPTGIVVQCQNERSQHSNRHSAMKVLRSRLYELRLREREDKMNKLGGEKKEIAWGSQIRSYVFHPYQMVKDHRTNVEVGNVNAVMDGEIDRFITTFLKAHQGENR